MALNVDHRPHSLTLASLGLPDRAYVERDNSTWPAFAVEHEQERTNGGSDAGLGRAAWVELPEMGVLVLGAA